MDEDSQLWLQQSTAGGRDSPKVTVAVEKEQPASNNAMNNQSCRQTTDAERSRRRRSTAYCKLGCLAEEKIGEVICPN